ISSNWRAEGDLVDWLAESGIVGISDVDTRALTRHLREAGSMRVGIFSGPAAEAPEAALLARVQASPQMAGAKLVDEVSITAATPRHRPVAVQRRRRWPPNEIADPAAADRTGHRRPPRARVDHLRRDRGDERRRSVLLQRPRRPRHGR